jgi:hypothetical protein
MGLDNDGMTARVQRWWFSSRGVQRWLIDALKKLAAESARRAADRLAPRPAEPRAGQNGASGNGSSQHAGPVLGPYPRTAEELQTLITYLKETILHLDDVQDYETVRAIDDDMYHLWKELERKMQLHRQSEARFQLREMFRI